MEKKQLFVLLVLLFSCSREKQPPQIFSEPVLSTTSNGISVNTYGYTDILTESPDLFENLKIQIDNDNPFIKIHPKRSSEIKSNRLGCTTPRMPRTAANDYLPLEPIRLIDGDSATCWCSKSIPQANAEPG